MNKSLWRGDDDFLTMAMSIPRTAPPRRDASRALKQVFREHTPPSRRRLRSTTKPYGSKHLFDTIESTTLGRLLGRFLATWCAKREAKLVSLIHA